MKTGFKIERDDGLSIKNYLYTESANMNVTLLF